MTDPIRRAISRCVRAAPFVLCLLLAGSQSACEKPVSGDPVVGVAGRVISNGDLSPVESASVRLVTDRVDLLKHTDVSGEFNFVIIGNSVLKNAVIIVKKSGYVTFDTVFARVEGESASDVVLELVPLL